MKNLMIRCLLFGLVGVVSFAAQPTKSAWEKSVVTLEITRKHYDYFQPWSQRTESLQKNGVVIGDRQILTTAEYLNDRTLIRVQKNGRGTRYEATLSWIDYHANLALITAEEPKLWQGLRAVRLADPEPGQGNLQVIRWRNGNLEVRKAEFSRFIVKRAKLSFVDCLHMEITSEIAGAGWAEAVVHGSKLLGLASSQDGNTCTVLPSSFVRPILEARHKGTYHGLGYFDFIWQKVENPATLSYLKLTGEPRGVIITDFISESSPTNQLQVRDIILEADGFAIDNEGDYPDPDYGNLSLENLASRHKWAGDTILLKVWRDGKMVSVPYTLPKAEYDVELVPDAVYDQPPEYCVAGGLVFQPLVGPYLRNWGADWQRKAPFRFMYFTEQKKTVARPSLVILSQVLPDACNLGYQDLRFLTVNKVNDRRVNTLNDLTDALNHPVDGFHVVELITSDTVHQLVLDANQASQASNRIRQRYGLEKDQVIHSQ
jgi:hypothetical protein